MFTGQAHLRAVALAKALRLTSSATGAVALQ